MKKYLMILHFFLAMLYTLSAFAQVDKEIYMGVNPVKKIITIDSFKDWVKVKEFGLNANGKYAWYSHGKKDSVDNKLIICGIESTYRKEFASSRNPKFLMNGALFFFETPQGASLLNLKTGGSTTYTGYDFIFPNDVNSEWFSYKIEEDMIVMNLLSKEQYKINNVSDSMFDRKGNIIAFKSDNTLTILDLNKGIKKVIAEGNSIRHYSFDSKSENLAFCVTENSNHTKLCMYHISTSKTHILISKLDFGDNYNYKIQNVEPKFVNKDRSILFQYSILGDEKSDSLVLTDKIDIWNYKDSVLQSSQLNKRQLSNPQYKAIYSIVSNKVVKIESSDRVALNTGNLQGKYIITKSVTVDEREEYWNNKKGILYTLISLDDGNQIRLTESDRTLGRILVSPNDEYVVWYDITKKHYFSYSTLTHEQRIISSSINVPLYSDIHSLDPKPYGIAGWSADGESIFVYDKFDIWRLSLNGNKPPTILTNNYGRLNKVGFRIINFDKPNDLIIKNDDELILATFNYINKYNGFSKLRVKKKSQLELGKLTPDIYYFPGYEVPDPPEPLKALKSDIYIVQKMNSTTSPNFYYTRDFKTYTAISNVRPEKEYNWLTTELVHWKDQSGEINEGILYKPENFDSTKKYPIIFHYYERFSQQLYLFKHPELFDSRINIPLFVSNGYIVFVPDIKYRTGQTCESVVSTITSAASHFKLFKWVDASKMGLQGHSFGGYETNCLVANTSLFAAAQSAAGISNLVSYYGSLGFGESSLNFYPERGQGNLRTTPWESPQTYIDNSPIFAVDKIQTPLLLVHSKGDDNVPFNQSVELFSSLRRLKKRVWLLQYDGEGHTVGRYQLSKLDYTIRTQQFFNHYLKDQAAPKWMTEGVPARFKGKKSGLALDKMEVNP